jgi:hypothetical protein
MSKKYNINGKEVEAPGKFSLFGVIKRTPEERLKELQQLYNSQECEFYTPQWKLKMKAWHEEMQEIIKLYPHLAPIELKTYTLG